MRFGNRFALAALAALALAIPVRGGSLVPVHQQRYAMGTIFDVVVYAPSRRSAERAIGSALDEVVRLERVMSRYRSDSDVSTVNRDGHRRAVPVDPSLHDVLRASLEFSRRSGGVFDVTIAPLLRVWKSAAADGRRPSTGEIARAKACTGYEKVDVSEFGRVRLRSACAELDLGGIGKGYAVDRALAVLKAAGIRDALVNGGSSSIAAAGAPPGRDGWPVRLGRDDGPVLSLRDESVSTSQQDPALPIGEIVHPIAGRPADGDGAVSVVAPDATTSDALSTTVLMLPRAEAVSLLGTYADVSAVWTSPAGDVRGAFRESRLRMRRAN